MVVVPAVDALFAPEAEDELGEVEVFDFAAVDFALALLVDDFPAEEVVDDPAVLVVETTGPSLTLSAFPAVLASATAAPPVLAEY